MVMTWDYFWYNSQCVSTEEPLISLEEEFNNQSQPNL